MQGARAGGGHAVAALVRGVRGNARATAQRRDLSGVIQTFAQTSHRADAGDSVYISALIGVRPRRTRKPPDSRTQKTFEVILVIVSNTI